MNIETDPAANAEVNLEKEKNQITNEIFKKKTFDFIRRSPSGLV
jgi:hypothetical protein